MAHWISLAMGSIWLSENTDLILWMDKETAKDVYLKLLSLLYLMMAPYCKGRCLVASTEPMHCKNPGIACSLEVVAWRVILFFITACQLWQ